MANHTVEKIGGTSMSNFDLLVNNIFIGNRTGSDLYNRIFVVSAYGGITDLLLEHKKTGAPGVYSLYAEGNPDWRKVLRSVEDEMCQINSRLAEKSDLDLEKAYAFVKSRISGLESCLSDLSRLCSYGHFLIKDYLPACREMLSAVGEAHSAFNSTLILQGLGVNAKLVDLSGWMEEETYPMDEKIVRDIKAIDLETTLPIVTGYTKCREGIMTMYDRGYSEITFSKLALLTDAKEGIIHKEFHLSTGDPKLIGVNEVRIIGETNFDIADQLADLGMEAIHPKASKEMSIKNIAIRIKNAFEPDHPGTLISRDYISQTPRVEMILGKKNLTAIEVHDPAMVGTVGYDYKILRFLDDNKVSYITKSTNANTITHYVDGNSKGLEQCLADLKGFFPQAKITSNPVSVLVATGSNMKVMGLLAKASDALAIENIDILGFSQSTRQVTMQFIVNRKDFDNGIKVLHRALVETHN